MIIDTEKLKVRNQVSTEEFIHLRDSVGFQALSRKQAVTALKNTSYVSALDYNGETVGIARLLFDFCTDAYITDVIVLPEFQGNGLGSVLMDDILEFIRKNAFIGTKVACTLYANKEKEEFYKRFGFEKLPNKKYGYGMMLEF